MEMEENESRWRDAPQPARRWTTTERVSREQRRHYLRRRLDEMDQLIDLNLRRYLRDLTAAGPGWHAERTEVWEDVLHLNYLEANRQAIVQSLVDLNTPAYAASFPFIDDAQDDVDDDLDQEGALRGPGTYS